MTKQRVLNQLQLPYGIEDFAGGAPVGSATPTDADASSAAVGSSSSSARQDHKHRVPVGTPNTITPGATPNQGSSAALARADHAHGAPAYGNLAGTICQGNDARLPTAPITAALAGTVGAPSGSNKFVTSSDPRLASSVFVFTTRGTLGGFTDWATLYTAMSVAADAVRFIVVDSDVGDPAVIPGGTYDLTNVTIVGNLNDADRSYLNISAGVVLTGARSFQGHLQVNVSAVASVITLGSSDIFYMGPDVLFIGDGDKFITTADGSSAQIIAAGQMDGDGFPIVTVGAGAMLTVILEEGFNDLGHAFDGEADSQIIVIRQGTAVIFDPTNAFPGTVTSVYAPLRMSLSGTVNPMTGDENDKAALTEGMANYIQPGAANRIVTGIVAGSSIGPLMTLINIGSKTVTFTNEDSASLAANRILTSGGVAIKLKPNGTLQLWYDITAARWRALGTSTGGSGGSSDVVDLTASDATLTADDVGKTYTNRGSSADRMATLPASAGLTPGDKFYFRCATASHFLKVKAQGSDIVVLNPFASGAAGYTRVSERGACLEIEYQGSGEFFGTAITGGWSVDE